MGSFLGEQARPAQTVVDPRKTIRLSWKFIPTEGEPVVAHFQVWWRLAGQDDYDQNTVIVAPTQDFYDVPPNTFQLGEVYVWGVAAWGNNPQPDTDPYYWPFVALGPTSSHIIDCSGWEVVTEIEQLSTSGSEVRVKTDLDGSLNLQPGVYEFRATSKNLFNWGPYSIRASVTLYNTNKWVFRNGLWQAVIENSRAASGFSRLF